MGPCGGGGGPAPSTTDPFAASTAVGEQIQAPLLPADIANNFAEGEYKATSLTQPLRAFRAFGGNAGMVSRWFGATAPDSAAAADALYNVTPYGNTCEFVQEFEIPAGTTVYEGPVAGGSAYQYYVPNFGVAQPVGEPWLLPRP